MTVKNVSNEFKKAWPVIVIVTLLGALVALSAYTLYQRDQVAMLQRENEAALHEPMSGTEALDQHGITPLTAAQASNQSTTADDLAFIVEEEKLAHDVYAALYDIWGARVFSNITNSEATHQNMVWAVMESRGLTDPRTNEPGVFTNADLQELYNTLVSQGTKSAHDAYLVGVAIEERDIADLDDMMARLDAKDTDIKAVLESLRDGSENHLRAFNRQVERS